MMNTSPQRSAHDAVLPRQLGFRFLVTVGMNDGKRSVGCLTNFSPTLPDLLFQFAPSVSSGIAPRRRMPTEKLAYLAFHRGEEMPLCEPSLSPTVELRVHVVGGKVFEVRTSQEELANPLGFFAHPVEENAPYQEFYFFAASINAREDPRPIGTMLINDGMINPEDLDQGLAALQHERRIPIGQILVQQRKLSPELVEQAHKEQVRRRLRIGEILLEQGLISQDDIDRALTEQRKRRGKRLGQILVDLGIVGEVALYRTLARKFHIPFVDLDEVEINTRAMDIFEPDFLDQYTFLPLDVDEKTLVVAFSDPLDSKLFDALRFHSNRKVEEVLVVPSQLEQYRGQRARTDDPADSQPTGGEIDAILRMLESESGEPLEELEEKSNLAHSDSAVVRLANQIIIDAARAGASDIHIEPNGTRQNVLVRFRVDGNCQVYQAIPASYRQNLVARMKIMASLDIAERRKPQDGKIRFKLGKDKQIELRVSTMPTVNGNEDIVLRLLASSKPLPIEDMGMSKRNIELFKESIGKPYGLLLCVGPTGSGKTTTLHSALGHINGVERKIWTAEDPVEITQPGLRQVQVDPKIGFTFAHALRGFLRLDPDVIMIGEMRDHETASIGVEASLTGHLVLSTLHTNTAPETVTRLLDMGLDPFTFADALQAVLAQRLARRLCSHCRVAYEATDDEYYQVLHLYGEEVLARRLGISQTSDLKLWKAEGCDACGGNGYKGRLAIHELLVKSDDVGDGIQQKLPANEIRKIAVAEGMSTLLQDGIEKVVSGKTDLKQVLAVCSR